MNEALIEKVCQVDWNPETDWDDREQRNALAARGCFDAFQYVKISVDRVLSGEDAGAVAHDAHGDWYRLLFGPSVTAGVVDAVDLAGYRNAAVHIRRSMHIPRSRDALRDCMPALFDMLGNEREPAVRAVLGHFVFVYLHPYMDGNGRIGRFLMNLMLASGGHPWTVISVERREDYMRALESASVAQDIAPFAQLLASLVRDRLRGHPVPEIPRN